MLLRNNMSKLSEYLASEDEDKPSNRKAIIKLKLTLIARKVSKSKKPELKSAFAEHLEKIKK